MLLKVRLNLSHRTRMLASSNKGGSVMLKNILAAVGVVVIAKKGYGLFRQYKAMEAQVEFLRKGRGEA